MIDSQSVLFFIFIPLSFSLSDVYGLIVGVAIAIPRYEYFRKDYGG